MSKQNPLDTVFHAELVPVGIHAWQLLAADNAYRHHAIVSFGGVPGYLISAPDSNDCCLFMSSADGQEKRVPITALLLVQHVSDIFVEDVKQFLVTEL